MVLEHIRIVGVAVAVALAAYGTTKYGRGGWRKLDLLFTLVIALGLAVVSIFPKSGNFLALVFNLENRAFAILSFASLVLFLLFLYLLGQVRASARKNGDIVSAMAVHDYRERYGDDEEIKNRAGKVLMIVVPAYNESGGIRPVLKRIPDEILGYKVKTVVVDDGSSDDTLAVAREEGFPAVSHVVNRGQGDALRTGFDIARYERADVVVNLDADGQYRPEEIELLLKPIDADEADYVHGSRFLGHYEEAGSIRHIGVVFFSVMLSILTRTKITDCTNGFRAIRGSMIHKLDLREESYSANELILEAFRNGFRFKEVPVTMLKRSEGESKKPPSLAYPFGVFRVIIKTWLR